MFSTNILLLSAHRCHILTYPTISVKYKHGLLSDIRPSGTRFKDPTNSFITRLGPEIVVILKVKREEMVEYKTVAA